MLVSLNLKKMLILFGLLVNAYGIQKEEDQNKRGLGYVEDMEQINIQK